MFVVLLLAQPKFIVTPKDKSVGLGRAVSLRCQVRGNPPPAVFWNKETSEVRKPTTRSLFLIIAPWGNVFYSVLVSVSWPKALYHLEGDNLFRITVVVADWLG